MASPRRLHLALFEQRAYDPARHDGLRIRVVASQPNLIDVNVFRYRQRPIAPGQATALSDCTGVCSSVDMEELPVGAPAVNANPAWFRLDYVDILCLSRHEADLAWATLQAEVGHLIGSVNAEDDMVATSEAWIGPPP